MSSTGVKAGDSPGGISTPIVLIASVDPEYYLLLTHILETEGFRTLPCTDLLQLPTMAAEHRPAGIVLDCRIESSAAPETCAELRRSPATRTIPILALVPPDAERLHLELLKAGIDESLTRPFAPAQLVDLLRRMAGLQVQPPARASSAPGHLTVAGLELILDRHKLKRGSVVVALGALEFRMLLHLIRNPGQAFTRRQLIQAAWPEDAEVDIRTVDVHMGSLRKLIRPFANQVSIRTVRSVGYRLDVHPIATS